MNSFELLVSDNRFAKAGQVLLMKFSTKILAFAKWQTVGTHLIDTPHLRKKT